MTRVDGPSFDDILKATTDAKQDRIAPTLAVMLPHRGVYNDLPKEIKLAYEEPTADDRIWIAHIKGASSASVYNYDSLWCLALNEQLGGGVTEFAMFHDDVYLPRFWVDTLKREAQRVNADFISAVIPIRGTPSGITSTGVDTPDGSKWSPRRFTMHEVMKKPTTWTEPGLVLNTGCCWGRFNAPCFKGFSFHMHNRIVKVWSELQKRMVSRPEMRSEDWEMSRYIARRGGRIFATTALKLYHGTPEYHNHYAWGEWQHEQHGAGAALAMAEDASS